MNFFSKSIKKQSVLDYKCSYVTCRMQTRPNIMNNKHKYAPNLPMSIANLWYKFRCFEACYYTRIKFGGKRGKQETIPVGCVPPACQPYKLQPTAVSNNGGGVSSNEQVWTGLQYWPPGVTNRGLGLELGLGVSHVPCLMVRGVRGSLFTEVQCITGNGHMGTPREQTDTSENITFPQLR